MSTNQEHRHTIKLYSRQVQSGSGLQFCYHEVHALFDELIDRPWGATRWHPPADVRETDEAFLIEMDVSGVSVEQVEILVEDRVLLVKGQRRLKRAEAGGVMHVCERPEGQFTRTFRFDAPIEADAIQRSVTNGVLTVVVPKTKNPQGETDG